MHVVDAQHRGAVERQPLGELDERLPQAGEVVPVGLHVVGVDVGDHRDHRRQIEERAVRFVGLDDDVVAGAEPGVRAGADQPPADHEGGVEPACGQHRGDQAGRRRLAVRAGDRDALLELHQLGQHHRARHDRHAPVARADHLGIVAAHRGRGDDAVGALDVGGVMPEHDGGAERIEPARRRAAGDVRAADPVAQVEQHLGDAAHARAADADEVDVLDLVFHGVRAACSHTSATWRAASGRASARARPAIAASAGRSSPPEQFRQSLRCQPRLRHQHRRLLRRQEARVAGLVVVDRVRERHQHAGHADGRDFGHRHRARAADQQVGLRVGTGHVVDELEHRRADAQLAVARRERVAPTAPALVHHHGTLLRRQQRQRRRHHVVERLRSQAAADYQQVQRAGAPRVARLRRVVAQHLAAQRIAGALCAWQGAGKRLEHPRRDAREQPVGQAGHRILFVHHQRPPQQRGHHAAREGDVAAHPEHHRRAHRAQRADAVGERAQQPQRQQQPGRQPLAAHRRRRAPTASGCRARAPASLPCRSGYRATRHASRARASRRQPPARA